MRKIILLAAALAMLTTAAIAQTQTKPAPGKCYPDFINTCVQQCNKVGGQIRGCPAWCAKEKRDRNCP